MRWIFSLFDGNGFCQISWLVDVAPAAYRDVIREELQRNDFQQRRENFRRRGKLDDVVGGFASEMVFFRGDGDDDAVAGFDFFDVGDAFFVAGDGFRIGVVARGQDDDGQIFIDERVGAVFHFAGGIAFGVNVRNFLQFQSAFQSDRIVNAAA